jgi:hypothetical protein
VNKQLSEGEASELADAIAAAAKEGVYDALRMHKRLGNSIATYRDGRIVWIPPEEIEVPEATN